MKKRYLFLISAIVFVTGCQKTQDVKEDTMMVGGACSYQDYINKVKIISIKEKSNTQKCQKTVDVKYEVIEKAKDLPNPPHGILTQRVSKAYMIKQGFDIGTTHSMKSSIIKSGTCDPIIEKLIGIDEAKFQKECKN